MIQTSKEIQNLVNTFKGIDYGCIDRDGNPLKDASDEDMYKRYRLASLSELMRYKVGTCWDITNGIHVLGMNNQLYVNQYLLIGRTISGFVNDPTYTHTFPVVRETDQSKWYIVECSWDAFIKANGNVVGPLHNPLDALNIYLPLFKTHIHELHPDVTSVSVYQFRGLRPGMIGSKVLSTMVSGKEVYRGSVAMMPKFLF